MDSTMNDYEIAEELALVCWGDTGFRCGDCDHDKGWHLESRPRMFECSACNHQQSVVAGTIMEASKVPLKAWLVRAEFYERGVVPTSPELARAADIGRSTAWLLNQKWMAALPGKAGQVLRLTVACRRPRKRLADEVSQDLRVFWTVLRRGEVDAATVRIDDEEITIGPAEEHEVHPIGQRIAERIDNIHQGVCIRWMKRWVSHYIEALSEARRSWLQALLQQPPLPLVRLAPT